MTDLDPLLHDAMATRSWAGERPTIADRRASPGAPPQPPAMTATVGVVACTGVATAALIIRRDSGSGTASVSAAADSTPGGRHSADDVPARGHGVATTTVFGLAGHDDHASGGVGCVVERPLRPLGRGSRRSGAVDQTAADVMPTAEQFGCSSPECEAMFNYVVWHEIANPARIRLDVVRCRTANPSIDFSQFRRRRAMWCRRRTPATSLPPTIDPNNETPTTISVFEGVMLIDGGAPAGAMEDAYQRLPGYDRTIVPSTGKTVEQTMVMPIGDNAPWPSAVGGVFGIGGFDTWDPSFIGTRSRAWSPS